MKKLIPLIICVLIISCTKESSKLSQMESSDRLVFKDFSEFHETSVKLAKMMKISDLQFWAQERNHSTLLLSSDTNLINYSPSLRAILNKDSEFQMGDSIVWFHSATGNLYTFAKNASFIDDLKAKPDSYRRSGYITSRAINPSSSKGGHVPLGGYYYPYITPTFKQYLCLPSCTGNPIWGVGDRKWVSELRDQTEFYTGAGYWESTLYLVIKLEWYSSSTGWHEATELRNIAFNISGEVSFVNTPDVITIPSLMFPSGTFNCDNEFGPYSGNLWVPEASVMNYAMTDPMTLTYWDVVITGYVYQNILGNIPSKYDPYIQYVYWPPLP